MPKTIKFFNRNDKYYQLSNFAGFGFELDGHYWKTMEHYFQAQKFIGTDQFEKIRDAGSPKQAKALGQSRAVPIRKDWEEVKENIMLQGLREKFKIPELRSILLSTGKKELIEDSPNDAYWGVGPRGKGKNRLGHLLMELREELGKDEE